MFLTFLVKNYKLAFVSSTVVFLYCNNPAMSIMQDISVL